MGNQALITKYLTAAIEAGEQVWTHPKSRSEKLEQELNDMKLEKIRLDGKKAAVEQALAKKLASR